MYIADTTNHRVRKVTVSTGIITTIAGTGASSYTGDGGAATSATLNGPTGVALDSAGSSTSFKLMIYFYVSLSLLPIGNVFIADSTNNRIRKVTVSTGVVSTVAGTGTASYSGDGGAATSATLNNPYGVATDASGTYALLPALLILFNHLYSVVGNVYIADYSNHRVRKVTAATGAPSVSPSVAPAMPRYDVNYRLYFLTNHCFL